MSYRRVAGLGFGFAVAALVFAYVLQYGFGLTPCPLCIFQRVAMAGFGLVTLAAAAHAPRGPVGRRAYAVAALLAALIGLAIALRHVWLLHLPPSQVPACGPGLDYLIQIMPLREVVATILAGDASCADVSASFAGLSLPAWSAISFAGLSVVCLVVFIRSNAFRTSRNQ